MQDTHITPSLPSGTQQLPLLPEVEEPLALPRGLGVSVHPHHMVTWMVAALLGSALLAAAALLYLRMQPATTFLPIPDLGFMAQEGSVLSADLIGTVGQQPIRRYVLTREALTIPARTHAIVQADFPGSILAQFLLSPQWKLLNLFLYLYDGKEGERREAGESLFNRANILASGEFAKKLGEGFKSQPIVVEGGDMFYLWSDEEVTLFVTPALRERHRDEGVVPATAAVNEGSHADGAGTQGASTACGNGQAEGNEGCDDGNTNSGDGCSALCAVEAKCGNGEVEATQGEQCDHGAENSNVRADACRTNCKVARCGDGVTDAGEECDDGNTSDGDDCAANCAVETCGNGIVNAGEECDNGSGNSDTAAGACRTSCKLATCGDGVTDAGEQCDGDDGCDSSCLTEVCGNGVLQSGEQCDDGNMEGGDGCSAVCLPE